MPRRGEQAAAAPRRAARGTTPGQSEALLWKVLDTLPVMVGILTPEGILLGASRLPFQVFQLRAEETIGRPLADLLPWSTSLAIQSRLRDGMRRAAQGEIVCYDEELPTPAGPALVAEVWIVGVRDQIGNVTHLVVSGIDITVRKSVEQALRTNQVRTDLLVRSAGLGFWHWDPATNEAVFSREWKQQLGYADAELPNRYEEWEQRLHPRDRDATLTAVRDFIAGRRPDYDVEFRLRHKDGSWRWMLARADVLRNAHGKAVRMMGCHIDITERRRAARALQRSNDRLLALSGQLLDAREKERHLLARELHDEVGQALTAVKLNLEGLKLNRRNAAVRQAQLDDSIAIVGHALEQVRARSLDLRPPLLDELGLTAALRWLTRLVAERGGSQMAFRSTIGDSRYDSPVEIACFRIAQEALNNVVKHARARRISVVVAASDGRLHLRIHDDGAGFDVRAARQRAADGSSLGLIGMEERARLAGGTIAWRARQGRGTQVDVWFPVGPAAIR